MTIKTPAFPYKLKAHHRADATLAVRALSRSRLSQLRAAILLGLTREIFGFQDRVCCIGGIPDSGQLDTVLVVDVDEEFESVIGHEEDMLPTGVSATGGIGTVLAAGGAKVVEDAITGTVNLGDEAVSGGANVSVTGNLSTAEDYATQGTRVDGNPLQGRPDSQGVVYGVRAGALANQLPMDDPRRLSAQHSPEVGREGGGAGIARRMKRMRSSKRMSRKSRSRIRNRSRNYVEDEDEEEQEQEKEKHDEEEQEQEQEQEKEEKQEEQQEKNEEQE